MIRFFLLWFLVSGAIGGFIFVANTLQKKEIRNVGWKALISAAVGGFIVISMMALNNIQGV